MLPLEKATLWFTMPSLFYFYFSQEVALGVARTGGGSTGLLETGDTEIKVASCLAALNATHFR